GLQRLGARQQLVETVDARRRVAADALQRGQLRTLVDHEDGLVGPGPTEPRLERALQLVELVEAALHVLAQPLRGFQAPPAQSLQLGARLSQISEPARRLLLERALDDGLELGGHARIDLAEPRRILATELLEDLDRVLPGERRAVGEELVEDRTHREDVG